VCIDRCGRNVREGLCNAKMLTYLMLSFAVGYQLKCCWSLFSNRTVRRRTVVLVIHWLYWLERQRISFGPEVCGLQCSGYHTGKSVLNANMRCGRYEAIPGLRCSSQPSTKQLTSGANGSSPVWRPTDGTLNTYCNYALSVVWLYLQLCHYCNAWFRRFPLCQSELVY